MFMGYSIDRWVGVIEWVAIVSILFTSSIILSCILANKTLHKGNKKSRIRKSKNKSWFIDVA